MLLVAGCPGILAAADENGGIAIMHAAQHGHPEVAKVLLHDGKATAVDTVLVDGEIALTKPLCLCEEPSDWQRENYHCEPRPSSGARGAAVAGAEGRVWAVGAQAWSAPR